MFTKDFWDDRVAKYGHTGYGDPFLYAFDQEARKFAIDELIKELKLLKTDRALDFGCGSGDFIELLNKKFVNVDGFDISEKVLEVARKRFAGSETISFTNDSTSLRSENAYDLILTVTVLQGLLNEELKAICPLIFRALSDKGFLLCMEFFATEARNEKQNESKATLNHWAHLLKNNNMKVIAEKHFYNPVLFSSRSYKNYKKNPVLKFLKVFGKFSFVQKILARKARQLILAKKDVLGDQNSTFKIFIIQKHAGKT